MADEFKISTFDGNTKALRAHGMSAVLATIRLTKGRWIAAITNSDREKDVTDLLDLPDGAIKVANCLGLYMSPVTFKAIRRCQNLTQTELATFVRVSNRRTVRFWESGDRPISGPVSLIMEYIDEGVIDPAAALGLDQTKKIEQREQDDDELD